MDIRKLRKIGLFVKALACVMMASAVAAQANAQNVFGGGGITIPAGAPTVTVGAGAPYPSTTLADGMKFPVAHVSVIIKQYYHSYVGDVGILLVGPQGQTCVLAGRCGGSTNGMVANFVTFDDDAGQDLPATGFPNGSYRPTACLLGSASFAAPAPPPPYGTTLGEFQGTDGNGEWKLYVQDFVGGDSGAIGSGWEVDITESGPSMALYTSAAALTIPAGAPGTTLGPASVYPSTIPVSGLTGTIAAVGVRLNGLTHTFPEDLDILLVGPNFQSCMLMSDVGGGNPGVSSVDLGFIHNASQSLPIGNPTGGGTFLPTDVDPTDIMPGPAPAGPYGTSLDVFNGSNPNGNWSLYVVDDAGQDVGALQNWQLALYLNDRCPADFNGSGTVEVQDIFDFLSAWFAGCP